ncbi:hypothetical protein CUJ83_08500 [Methanocella sp. CWC-04]|uniref:Dinitrogenase iron-molybdenum cofactor biosynthesis domain-containing protein n=1 Tax=Methanooceanicella nereidis TaxID=2052831 RepID=A0AAP2W526_9EURY|nr:NifB/NifX family molybdenum-iron cluster-binding protein [Methanocella sp. CWC-04]MCD1295035.1 hypothetical protein [Methanocella sp. CWC-04]
MKVCIPKYNDMISENFDKASEFVLFYIRDNQIAGKLTFKDESEECRPATDVVRERGVTHLITYDIDDDSLNTLLGNGMMVYKGVEGDVDLALEKLLNGKLICEWPIR